MKRDYTDKFEMYVEENLQAFKRFPNSVKEEIEKSLRLRKSSIASFVAKCETPIEQLLAVHLIDVEEHLYKELTVLAEFKHLFVIPQKEVLANGRKYRVDFLIECQTENKNYLFAIECDGHNFHEKTKEQAARDKARERNLMKEGYTIIRFTGSEIWKSPSKCAVEAEKIISKTVGLVDYYEKLLDEE
ncbi:endonuclease domain-containing protein [Virgibacillus oceani]